MNDVPVQYETVEAELQRLIDNLYGAAPAVVRAETDRLRALAEQVQDERGRERALFRAAQLPRLVAGPLTGTSPQYEQAQFLLGRALAGTGPAETRIPEIERIINQIGDLANQAPSREAGAIRRTTSTLLRLIDELRAAE
jgi:predicted RNase H-like nuclease